MLTKKPFILSVKDEEHRNGSRGTTFITSTAMYWSHEYIYACTRACYGASGKVLLSRYARDFFLQLRVFIHGLFTYGLFSSRPLSICDENRYSSLHRF